MNNNDNNYNIQIYYAECMFSFSKEIYFYLKNIYKVVYFTHISFIPKCQDILS